jgi:hypothetical protein
MRDFGPRLSETDAIFLGKCVTAPERHFVPEVHFKMDERTAGRFCCNRQNPKARGYKS